MSRLRMFLAKLFVLLTLSLGRMPHVVALLELFQPPSVAHVLHIRRRRLAYTEFFTLLDRDGRRAAPIARSSIGVSNLGYASNAVAYESYIPVDAA